ncbi:hypothetical protein PAHAL_8G254600 [Panicum hallii]|jgi:ariadne-1|uniref:RBR-type E3 ubiquitin transferase n=1 Tax=Panicum hallii TaxID=206008 RepID=A0A2S3IFL5_9POAL|nr:probable E3 ubiquitin-protein ligase ARI5 [Panicum hallii]PAN43672.1 hypothetical protein PAHAL_8G254600 [Panicum hallii]
MATNGDGVSENGRSKRFRATAGSTGHHDDGDNTSDGTGEDYDAGSDDYGGYDEETVGYASGEDYFFNDDCNGEETWVTSVVDDCDRRRRQERVVVVLTEDDVRRRQDEVTAKVAEILSFPAGFAAAVLRHCGWDAGRVEDQWFSDDRRVRGAVGLPPTDGAVPVPTALSAAEAPCGICFTRHPAGQMRSAACRAHFYCGECWRGYIAAAVGEGGARCLSLRCPEPACAAAVVRELVDAAAGAADRSRYARFALRSFVEEGAGHRIKWCPGPGCTRAVELAAGGADADADVFCDCRHGFCWRCGEEAHRPLSCETVRAWLEKNSSFSETANWVLANTKPCPSCRRPMEKDQGCMHMTCPPPCGHQFCWVCLDPWDRHRGCVGFRPDGDEEDAAADPGSQEKVAADLSRRRLASASDRYLYHYERWVANFSSLESVFRDMAELEGSEIARIAAVAGLPETEFGFLTRAYEVVAGGRRVLKWAHAYGYYLDPGRDAARRGLLEDLLDQANAWLERLHASAELERRETFCSSAEPAVIREVLLGYYKGRVENLTAVTRTFLGNLVKAFESDDLPKLSH